MLAEFNSRVTGGKPPSYGEKARPPRITRVIFGHSNWVPMAERMLETEITGHLGYEKHASEGRSAATHKDGPRRSRTAET